MGIASQHVGDRAHPGSGFAFVGREREIGLLLAAVLHPPAIVLVEGEAGIGKSRLVREAVAAAGAARAQVLTGYCHPLREPSPYGPIIDALHQAGELLPPDLHLPPSTGALAPLLPDLAARLPAPPPRSVDSHAERFQLVHGLRSFLSALGPVILVIEDVHWVDDETREMLLLLSRTMPPQLSMVLTFRGEDIPPDRSVLGSAYRRQPGTSGVAIHVDPLSESAVRDLAYDALGSHATPELGAALYQRSQGLPLVAEEDLLTLAEHGRRGAGPGADDLLAGLEHAEVPRGLREAFTERLAVLSPAGRAVVEAAAVLGVAATEPLLTQVAGLDADQGAAGVTEALRAAVLHETGPARYAFRHVLAQQVAYRQIPGPLRSRLHRRAITVLEAQSPPPLVQIAHHTLQLGDQDAWVARAEAAADQAIELGDVGTAAALLRRILDRPGLAGDVRSRAALSLAAIVVNGVDYVTNAAALRRILADPQLPTATRGEIRLSLGLLVVNHAGDRTGFQELARAADELADRPARAARAMIALAMNERNGPTQSWAWMDRAEQTLRGTHDEAMSAAARATELTMLARAGDPGVWALTDRLPRRSDDDEVVRQTTRALYNTGEIAIELGHDRRARRMLTESHELACRVNFAHMESYNRIALLRLDALAGHWADIEKRFSALRGEYPDIAMAKTDETLIAGHLAAARGQRSRAVELAGAAMAYGEAESQVTVSLRAAALLTGIRLDESSPRAAWAIAAPAVATLRLTGAWARGTGLVPVAVEAALACGERPAAERLVADAELGLAGRDAPAATAEFHTARGILLTAGDPRAAAESFERALQLWTEIGRPYEVARGSERLGVTLAATGAADVAAFRLQEALATYEHLGAAHDSARCRLALQELGLAGPARRGRRGYGNELSPRERQVADLVARGVPNKDIAEALFLSPRTVEQHVARLLKKLGATRATLAEALREADGRRPAGPVGR